MRKTIWKFFKNLWYRIFNRELASVEKKLKKAVKTKERRKLELKFDVQKMVRKYTKIDKDNISKYIPLDEKTKSEIRFQVDLKYGDEMLDLGVVLNNRMQLI